MSLLSKLRKACITLSMAAALSAPIKANANSIRDYNVNPQVNNLTSAIEYFQNTEIQRINTRLKKRISLNTSYQRERKEAAQNVLLSAGRLRNIQYPGCFDRATVSAIRKLQKENGIYPMDGAIGETTAPLIATLGNFELEPNIVLWPDVTCDEPNQQLITEIQTNLMLLNFLPDAEPNGNLDDATVNALREYKQGNAINNSDTIDNELIAHLGLNPEARIQKLNEALRQQSRLRGDWMSHVYVNIPEFKFRYYNNGRLDFTMDLVVGAIHDRHRLSKRWHTNVQRGYIDDVIVNPWWSVPEGGLTREVRHDMRKIKKLRKVMQQLYRGRWIFSEEVIGKRFRQIPGPGNPLGRVAYNIHGGQGEMIHDTPSRRLFYKTIREGSHGCMRASRPLDFTNRLQELGYFSGNLESYINQIDPETGFYQNARIELTERIPVTVVYALAWADESDNGIIAFFPNDIYKLRRTIVIPGQDR